MEPKEEGISSILTTHNRVIPDDIGYYVFDMMTAEEWDNGTEQNFIARYLNYTRDLADIPKVFPVKQWHITSPEEAETFYNGQIEQGHEGMILRQLFAKYKHGRCTVNQDGLWKFKEFVTHDAVIVSIEEQMKLKEGVERTRNELGHLERRFEQDLYEPAGMVGAFIVSYNTLNFKVKPGKGHNNLVKRSWWKAYLTNPFNFIGHHCEFKYMPHGTKDKPRIGSLVRFRPDLD
jgi:hypothetical protein